jgi:hypothetical protein
MEAVRLVALDLDIHPYVKGRLRLQRRQDETGGVLLGTADGPAVQITGFKRLAGSTLRQAANAAGPELIGFYRVQTPGMTTLQPEEEQEWRQILPHGRSVFLLIQVVEGIGTSAQVWTREGDAPPTQEKISLLEETAPPAAAAQPAAVALPRLRIKFPTPPKWVPAATAVLFTLVASAWCYQGIQPAAPPPTLALELQARDYELSATWEQSSVPADQLQSASLLVSEDGKEKTIDLTRRYSRRGHLVIRPTGRDVIVTLNVQYRGVAPLSNTAIYVGFRPRRATAPAPRAVAVDPAKKSAS